MPGSFDPFASIAELASTYAAEDYMAQRKRLREARAKWIEENECPTAYQVTSKDATGAEKSFSTPFQVGKLKYEGEYPQTPEAAFKPSFTPEPDNPTAAADLDELDEILEETDTFLKPGIYLESAHPEIKEGESHGEYCARIGREYEQATGTSAVRRPVADSDGVREPAAVDPGGERGIPGPGAGDRGPGGEDLRGDVETDHAGDAADGGGAGKPGDAAGRDTGRDSAG